MYIKVEFYDCENVNNKAVAGFEAYFKAVEDHFGSWYDDSGSLKLNSICIKLKNGSFSRYDATLFFKSTEAILTSDVFESYCNILGCKNEWAIEIRETPFDES